jgi:hypothetical protein
MATLPDLFYEFVSLVILLLAFTLRPTHAHCPPRWHNNGIRPSGAFMCTRNPVGDPNWYWGLHRPDRSTVPPGVLRGHIYCSGGTRPIVVDDRTVGCQRP